MGSLQDAMKEFLENNETPSHKIDRLYQSVIYKFDKTLAVVNETGYQRAKDEDNVVGHSKRFFLYKEEIEPLLTQEESDFIGFWKGSRAGRPILKRDCIEKRMRRMLYQAFPNLNAELRAAAKGKVYDPITGKAVDKK